MGGVMEEERKKILKRDFEAATCWRSYGTG